MKRAIGDLSSESPGDTPLTKPASANDQMQQHQRRKHDGQATTTSATYQFHGDDGDIESNSESTPDITLVLETPVPLQPSDTPGIALVVETPVPLQPSGGPDDDKSPPADERVVQDATSIHSSSDGWSVLRKLLKYSSSSIFVSFFIGASTILLPSFGVIEGTIAAALFVPFGIWLLISLMVWQVTQLLDGTANRQRGFLDFVTENINGMCRCTMSHSSIFIWLLVSCASCIIFFEALELECKYFRVDTDGMWMLH